MGFNAASNNSFIIIFCVFILLFADLIVTYITLSNLKGSDDAKSSEGSTEIAKLTRAYNSKMKYTVLIVTLVLIYYVVNAVTFAFTQSIK